MNSGEKPRASLLGLVLLFLLLFPRALTAGGSEAGEPVWRAFEPIRKPAPPRIEPGDAAWAKTPVDHFILAKLREQGLGPSPEADRRTLIRRLYLNLTGLPPSSEAVEAFVADARPDAYERLADQLLSSPRYGERWARHWIDVAHFAETHGHDQDRVRTAAWPYRDYLIESFNADKPFARFIEEQLAADALYPEEPEWIPALGFIAAGPWDESSLRDIREDTIDRRVARYVDRDNMVATVMSSFTSLTVHCARCHDHKFDPISQADYYSLQAVFAGVDRANRLYDADPEVQRRRKELLERKAGVERRDPVLMSQLTGQFQEELNAWEETLLEADAGWRRLELVKLSSAAGAELEELKDGSILSGGPRPDKDVYTILGRPGLPGITALRLEVLRDERLPSNGPGRQDNGNFHLSEIQIETVPIESEPGDEAQAREAGGNESASGHLDSGSESVRVSRAIADFEQNGWTIAHAIDGKIETAWGIFPAVGKSHEAIFEFEEEIRLESGRGLRVVLQQQHGGGHLIGRFKLSVTRSRAPVPLQIVPEEIRRIVTLPAASRSEEERLDLAAYFLKEKIEADLAALPPQAMVYAAASDFAPDGGHVPAGKPREVHLLRRGDIHQPVELAEPGTLSGLPGLPGRFELEEDESEGGRRAALAQWLSRPDNPLAWRSIVNRVWHYHFGRGIVATPNDFGRMGAPPSHPELLDWLASYLLEEGGSLKQLHRLIVTSAVYRQSSRDDPQWAEKDAENRYLWRMNRSRLDAESLRDTILRVTGRIDFTMGGPSDQQFSMRPGIHVTPEVDYSDFDWDSFAGSRRGIYRFLFRTLPDPFMDALDCPDGSQPAPVRTVSLSPLQALALLNHPFMIRQSERLAERARLMADGLEERVAAVYQLALSRPPSAEELEELASYAGQYGLENLCRVILNSNEFIFIP